MIPCNLTYKRVVKCNKDRRMAMRGLAFRIRKRVLNRSLLGVPFLVKKHRNEFAKKYWDYEKISAPSHFSLIENANEVLFFANKLYDAYSAHRKIYVKLQNVVSITNDAIVLLLSTVMKFNEHHIAFNGNKPHNKDVADIIQESGFYDIIQNGSHKYLESSGGYNIQRMNMYTHAQKNVDSALTADLIAKYTSFIWNEPRRCQGVQRIFVELMQNTNNHASFKRGEKYWWISVSKKENPNTLCFAFIDYGMGIFKSLNNKKPLEKFYGWVEKIAASCSPNNHSEVLKLMLQGKFHETITKQYYRGKGIPGIYHQLEKRAISKLIIISNDAYANASENVFYNLTNELKGTFVYFEVSQGCINLPQL